MTFHDLPEGSRDLPLTDPTIRADVVDLIVKLEDRRHGCLALLILDDEDRCAAPVVVTHMGTPTGDQVEQVCTGVLGHLDVPGLVMAIGRPGGPRTTDEDRGCHQAVLDFCRDHGVRLLGSYVTTDDDHVVELPISQRLAS